jgi:hypothetical protein
MQSDIDPVRYKFLNLINAEPNLGVPKDPGTVGGMRYMLLSNTSDGLAPWRVWSYLNPKIAIDSIQNSLAFGDNATINNANSFIFSNYKYTNNNPYNSQTFSDYSYGIYSLSGIFLYNATTIGDPASATYFVVTETGFVGIKTDAPAVELTVSGSVSANGSLTIDGNSTLGNVSTDTTIIRGVTKIADSSQTNGILLGSGDTSYDTNIYRSAANSLKTDDSLTVDINLNVNGNTTLGDANTDQTTINAFAVANASRSFVVGANTFTIGMSSTEAIASNKNLFVFDSVNFPSQPFRTVFSDGGNFRTVTDPTMILGTNSDQHLRFRAGGATSSQIRMTILSSGEVGIGTSIAETAAAGNGGLRIKNNLLVNGNSTLGDTSTDQTTIVGIISGNNPTTSFNAGSATGFNSFAANESKAFGAHSFAEGWLTIASGIVSHAEGYDTRASNNTCHAEGSTTVASGIASHAEGASTVASGTVSHAEGFQTSALGTVSHAEGQKTKAAGSASHAAGTKATAAQDYTYAWSDANLDTLFENVSTTRTGQYMVSASGGVFIPGNVGIGTDANSEKLTISGNVSANGNLTANRLTVAGTVSALSGIYHIGNPQGVIPVNATIPNVNLLASVGTRTVIFNVPPGMIFTGTTMKLLITSSNQTGVFTTGPNIALTRGDGNKIINDVTLSNTVGYGAYVVGDVASSVNSVGIANAHRHYSTDNVGVSIVTAAYAGGTFSGVPTLVATVLISGECMYL